MFDGSGLCQNKWTMGSHVMCKSSVTSHSPQLTLVCTKCSVTSSSPHLTLVCTKCSVTSYSQKLTLVCTKCPVTSYLPQLTLSALSVTSYSPQLTLSALSQIIHHNLPWFVQLGCLFSFFYLLSGCHLNQQHLPLYKLQRGKTQPNTL